MKENIFELAWLYTEVMVICITAKLFVKYWLINITVIKLQCTVITYDSIYVMTLNVPQLVASFSYKSVYKILYSAVWPVVILANVLDWASSAH